MRNRFVLLLDLLVFVLAVCGAFGLRFDWLFFGARQEFVPYVIAAAAIKTVTFYLLGMYNRFWRYATVDDVIALMVAGTVSSVAMAMYVTAGLLVFGFMHEFSRSVLLADWILTLGGVAGVRLSIRVLADPSRRRRPLTEPGRRVLVAGAGAAGAMVVREIQRTPSLRMTPVGFLDDDAVKWRKRIHGVPVIGSLTDLQQAVESTSADEVIVAIPTAPGPLLRDIAQECSRLGIISRVLPGVFELLDGNVSVSRLRQVDIADLLRRNPVTSGPEACSLVHGRRVLVTGAGGSIGFELCRQVAHGRPQSLVLLGHGENSIFEAQLQLTSAYPDVEIRAVIADIRDRGRLFGVFDEHQPELVFHAAAHKHVPLMEANPAEAITNNVLGTKNVVDASLRAGVSRLVLISSDKAVSPSSIMGASKRAAERLVRAAALSAGKQFVVVRFGNVLGSRGSVVPIFKRQIEAGGPVRVTHPEMRRFFMTIPEAVHLVLQAAAIGRGGELFVLKMGEALKIVDLARDLIRLSGCSEADIPIVFTGLRPGEKLEEVLWEEGATVESTSHPDVLQVREEAPLDYHGCAQLVGAIEQAARESDRGGIDAALAGFVPVAVPAAPVRTASIH